MKEFFISTAGPEETKKGLRMLHAKGWRHGQIEQLCTHVDEYCRKHRGAREILFIWLNPRGKIIIGTCWGPHSGHVVYGMEDFRDNIMAYNDC